MDIHRFANKAVARMRRAGWPSTAAGFTRESIAQHYLFGEGIEVGALHQPLTLPSNARAQYVDIEGQGQLAEQFPELAPSDLKSPDIVGNLETLAAIESSSQDFVIANHVLEHVENPIQALITVSRVLRPGGIAFLAVPEKTMTFDRDRENTTLSHLIRDFELGPDVSLREHYYDWCAHVDRLSGEALEAKVELLVETRGNVHFHVWEYRDMLELFHYICDPARTALSVQMSFFQGNEVIWILRKANAGQS